MFASVWRIRQAHAPTGESPEAARRRRGQARPRRPFGDGTCPSQSLAAAQDVFAAAFVGAGLREEGISWSSDHCCQPHDMRYGFCEVYVKKVQIIQV